MTPLDEPSAPENSRDQASHVDILHRFVDELTSGAAPDLGRYAASSGETSVELLVELICLELEDEIRAGRRRRIEYYLDRFPQLRSDATAVVQLLEAEFQLRGLHEDESITAEEYRGRFEPYWDLLKSRLVKLPPLPTNESAGRSGCHDVIRTAGAESGHGQRSIIRTTLDSPRRGSKPQRLEIGSQLNDFEIVAVLGEGAFGVVYLARQLSLARSVALKVTYRIGSEARTMARLEHDHIVQVFSETVDAARNLRLLCMQYVPGTTLGKIIRHWKQNNRERERKRDGTSLLEAIDALYPDEQLSVHRVSLKDRDLLARSDLVDAVAWLGGRIAEALDYAHGQGVLHRDIKPDNILISRFGRPYLADFNLAVTAVGAPTESVFGGSLGYMSPEHVDAFNPAHPAGSDVVTTRSDIYSLGVVLFELLTLKLPVDVKTSRLTAAETLAELAEAHRRAVPVEPRLPAPARDTLGPILRRCLELDPAERYASSAQLATDLDAARQLHAMFRHLPNPGRATRFAQRRPIFALVLAALLPNLLGSVVNIAYNGLNIVPQLQTDQRDAFVRLVVGYNLLAYPLLIAALVGVARPVVRQLRKPNDDTAASARKQTVALSFWITVIACLGWLPGGLIFPTMLRWTTGSIPPRVFGHFVADFSISGLVAATYSYFAVEAIALRVLYPKFLAGQSHPRRIAQQELTGGKRRLAFAQTLAGIIPLAGAVLLVMIGPVGDYRHSGFRWLVCGLIAMGMLGFCFAVSLASSFRQMVAAFTETDVLAAPPEKAEKAAAG